MAVFNVLSGARTARFLIDKGIKLNEQRNFEEALQVFDRALDIGDKEIENLRRKEARFKDSDHSEKAIRCFYRIRKVEKQNALLWFYKGTSYRNLHRYVEALTCYDKALKFDPQHAEIWFIKGVS
ncbi:MAG: tetratricopeptide repeat protein, partial [Actinomycetota bacterium]